MENADMHNRIAEIIEEWLEFQPAQVGEGWRGTLADRMRSAACEAHGEFPQATSRDFGDAALLVEGYDLHRQSSMNRWNETRNIWGDMW